MTLWTFDPANRPRHADAGFASGTMLGALFAALFCLVLVMLPGFPDRAWAAEAKAAPRAMDGQPWPRACQTDGLVLARVDTQPIGLMR